MSNQEIFTIIGCMNVAIATTNVAIAICNIKRSRFLDAISDSLVDLSNEINARLIPDKESRDSSCISGDCFTSKRSGD